MVVKDIKKIGEIRFDNNVSIEELQAIKNILTKAGLIVEVEERDLMILARK